MRKAYSIAALSGVAALVAFLAFAPAISAAKVKARGTGKGTISVTVKDETGNVVPGAIVSVMPHARHKPVATTQPTTQPTVNARAAARLARPQPVAEGVTNDKGIALLSDVPYGSYGIVARVKKVGTARGKVVITSSITAEVTLDLKKAGKK
jgi:hypothetical protein